MELFFFRTKYHISNKWGSHIFWTFIKMDRSLHILVLFHNSFKDMTWFFQKGTNACEREKKWLQTILFNFYICFQIFHVIYLKEKLIRENEVFQRSETSPAYTTGVNKNDIKISAHDVFLEQLSSDTLKVERLERQII